MYMYIHIMAHFNEDNFVCVIKTFLYSRMSKVVNFYQYVFRLQRVIVTFRKPNDSLMVAVRLKAR